MMKTIEETERELERATAKLAASKFELAQLRRKHPADNPEWDAEWDASPLLQSEFRSDKKSFIAFKRAEMAGRAKIIGGITIP